MSEQPPTREEAEAAAKMAIRICHTEMLPETLVDNAFICGRFSTRDRDVQANEQEMYDMLHCTAVLHRWHAAEREANASRAALLRELEQTPMIAWVMRAQQAEARVKELEEAARWIPLDEEMPPVGQRVPVINADAGDAEIPVFSAWDGQEWDAADFHRPVDKWYFTHWHRQLPKPPHSLPTEPETPR